MCEVKKGGNEREGPVISNMKRRQTIRVVLRMQEEKLKLMFFFLNPIPLIKSMDICYIPCRCLYFINGVIGGVDQGNRGHFSQVSSKIALKMKEHGAVHLESYIQEK
jgi:hypothetical protein